MAMMRSVMAMGLQCPLARLQHRPQWLRVGQPDIVADLDERRGGQPAVPDQFSLSPNGTTSSARLWRIIVLGFLD
jgi:hypothetical protein